MTRWKNVKEKHAKIEASNLGKGGGGGKRKSADLPLPSYLSFYIRVRAS